MYLLLLEDVCVLELIDAGEAVPFDIIVEIIEIFDNAVTPGGSDVSACSFDKKGAPGAFELFLGCTGAPGVGELHHLA